MNAIDVKKLVDDFAAWHGNSYKLAVLVMEAQKEADALLAEAADQQQLAEAIRGQ